MNKMKMPLLFVGHGSPMNAISDNAFTRSWEELGKTLPRPQVILAISAHWYGEGTSTNNQKQPHVINDMYGFPRKLYEVNYAAPGSPVLAARLQELLGSRLAIDNSWGIDHGTWSVLHKMYPKKDIPVIQLSINSSLTGQEHYNLGVLLRALREENVLIVASGNIVHNLMMVDWYNEERGFVWAETFDKLVKDKILKHDYLPLIEYSRLPEAKYAIPTPDHYLPLLYVLGASQVDDQITVFNEQCVMGSLSMTSYIFWPSNK